MNKKGKALKETVIVENRNHDDSRKEFAGIVSPLLEPFFRLIDKHIIQKYNLEVISEFWYFFILLAYSLSVYFIQGISKYTIFIFSLMTFLLLFIPNWVFFRKRLLPKEYELIDEFLGDIEKKSVKEVKQILKDKIFRRDQLTKLLGTKFKGHYEVYLYIYKYQPIRTELLQFIIEHDLLAEMDDKLVAKYIIKCLDRLSKNNYIKLKDLITKRNNKWLSKVLTYHYPFYSKQRNWINDWVSHLTLDVENFIKSNPFFRFGIWAVLFIRLFIELSDPKYGAQMSFSAVDIFSFAFASLILSGILGIFILVILVKIANLIKLFTILFSPPE